MRLPFPQRIDPETPAIPMILKLGREEIIHAVNQAYAKEAGTSRNVKSIPDNAEVTVRIPGGGDYSSTDLEIANSILEKDCTIDIRWKE